MSPDAYSVAILGSGFNEIAGILPSKRPASVEASSQYLTIWWRFIKTVSLIYTSVTLHLRASHGEHFRPHYLNVTATVWCPHGIYTVAAENRVIYATVTLLYGHRTIFVGSNMSSSFKSYVHRKQVYILSVCDHKYV